MRLLFINDANTTDIRTQYAAFLAQALGKEMLTISELNEDYDEYIAANDIDILCIACTVNRRTLQHYLDVCRTIRIPYLFLTDIQHPMLFIHHILMPVSMLEEEVYKGQICAHLARVTGASTTLLQAKDYGSKALKNTEKIQTLLDKFQLSHEALLARTDSFHVTAESCDRQRELHADILILTASREYGLDDIFFGPPERKVLQHSQVPVMLVNPRGDLFSLCD